MTADQNSIEKLVEQMNGDIRQIVGFLQMWQKRKNNKFIFATFSKEVERYGKDDAVTLSNFDAATILLNRSQRGDKGYKELLGLYFIDYDLVPLLVQENYLNSAGKDTSLDGLRRMAKAADSIARSDQINLLVRRDQNWKLLDAVGFTSSVLPCKLVADYCPFAKFPEFFGKFSSEKKMQREIKELKMAMMEHITGSGEAIKFDYAPGVFNLLKAKMSQGNENALEQAIEIYENYGLTPELVKEHLVDVIYNPDKKDLMEGVETKTKSSFTRLYNSKFKESVIHKKKKRTVAEDGMQTSPRTGWNGGRSDR
jgi:replication factor C subunit 1